MECMRVLLVNPPFRCIRNEPRHASPPVGLASMAAALAQHGFEVVIIDAVVSGYGRRWCGPDGCQYYGLPVRELATAVAATSPDLVGVSLPFTVIHDVVMALAADLKARMPSVPIVVGGAHASALPEVTCSNPSVDFVIQGEGERLLPLLAHRLTESRSRDPLPGLYWKDGDGVRGLPPQWIEDLDSLPPPAYYLLDMEAYFRINCLHGESAPGLRAMPFVTSRGCPGKCVFCSIHPVWGRRFRPHSVDYVLERIAGLVSFHGVNHLLIEDDNFSFDPQRAKRILAAIADRHPQLTWSSPNGLSASTLDGELISLIKRSGCSRLTLAVESGDQETLFAIIGKPLRLSKVSEVVQACRINGLSTTAFFVIGLPGETRDALRKSMAFAARLPVDSLNVMFATPYPGTALHALCGDRGFLESPFAWSRLTTQECQIRTPCFDGKYLKKLARRALLVHVLRNPRGALRRLRQKARVSPFSTMAFVWNRLFR